MAQKAIWKPNFFENILSHLYTYPTLWITEDGQIYLTEKQAKSRCEEKNRIAAVNKEAVYDIRYVPFHRGEDRVKMLGTIQKLRMNPDSFTEMFDAYENRMRAQVQEEERTQAKSISAEDARLQAIAELEAFEGVEEIVEDKISNTVSQSDVILSDYDISAVKSSIKVVIDPSLHHSSGEKKVREIVDSLSCEDFRKLVAELSKNS